MATKSNSKHKAAQEQKALRDVRLHDILVLSTARFKRFDQLVERMYAGEYFDDCKTDPRMMQVSACFRKTAAVKHAAFRALLRDAFICMWRHSALMEDPAHVMALYNICLYRTMWQADLLRWRPVSKYAHEQLRELTTKLFCRYKLPEVMYQAVMEQEYPFFMRWLVHLGRGGSAIQLYKMPLPATRKMMHAFQEAPAAMTIKEALRWAQVRAMDGSHHLAARVAKSWLGTKPFEDEMFWHSFIQVLVNGGMFQLDSLGELLDYVRRMKQENPGYSLKGRTLNSLSRQCEAWHKLVHDLHQTGQWLSCGIKGMRWKKEEGRIVITELLDSKALQEEGQAMKHCVATYRNYCLKGEVAIFSMRFLEQDLLPQRLATIEVNLALKRIDQAKAHMNKPINKEARALLVNWANEEGLTLNDYL